MFSLWLKFLEIQLYFTISIFQSKALKDGNFPDNLDFNTKTVAKLLLSSHFLLVYHNMTVKLQINHGVIQKVCDLLNGIFHFIHQDFTLCQTRFYSIVLIVLLTEITSHQIRQKNIFCIWLLQRITLY